MLLAIYWKSILWPDLNTYASAHCKVTDSYGMSVRLNITLYFIQTLAFSSNFMVRVINSRFFRWSCRFIFCFIFYEKWCLANTSDIIKYIWGMPDVIYFRIKKTNFKTIIQFIFTKFLWKIKMVVTDCMNYVLMRQFSERSYIKRETRLIVKFSGGPSRVYI